MLIEKSGGIYFDFDYEENKAILESGKRVIWRDDIELNGEKLYFYNEGDYFTIEFNTGSEREFMVFQTKGFRREGINKVAFAFEPTRVSIAMNGEIIHQVNPQDFDF